LRPKNVELADYGAVEKGAPLQGKIDQRRGEEGHGDMSGGFHDIDVVNLIGAAPQMQSYVRNMATILRNLRQLAIDIIADPKRQQRPHDHEHDQNKKPYVKGGAVPMKLPFHRHG